MVTSDLDGGDVEELALGDLPPGDYTVACLIPGHADAGMRADLEVTNGGGAAGPPTSDTADHGGHDGMDYAAMTTAMLDTMSQFPAATEGVGNDLLEPTEVLTDGTKVFDLVAAITPCERAPGDWILLHYFNEGTQTHPMHLHQFDQIVLARDGFPLDQPYVADVLNIAPGERYTVLAQLDKPGTWVWHCHILPHVEDDEGMFGMVTAVVVQ